AFIAQIIRKSVFDIFIGTSIFIFLLGLFTVYLVIRSSSLSFSLERWGMTFLMYVFPLFVGFFWAKHMLNIAGIESFLRGTYLDPRDLQINLQWRGIEFPQTETYLENAHSATFITSAFSILIATMFAATWFVFKLIGFYKAHEKKNYSLIIWLVFFYAFWQGFFALGSIRYLSPVIIPITLIFMIGYRSTVEFFNSKDKKERDGFFVFLFIATTAFLSLYPVIPLEAAFETDFHLRWYITHTHIFSLLGAALLFNIIAFLFLWYEPYWKMGYKLIFTKKFNGRKVATSFLIFILVVVPMIAQAALLVYCKFDVNEYHSNYVYYSRTSYEELKDAINRIGAPDWEVILTINTPGLEYYVSQPVLDLFMYNAIRNSGLEGIDLPLESENVTRLFDFFNYFNITMFVSQNSGNVWYPSFINSFYWRYYFYRMLNNNQLFTLRFTNDEYSLYTFNTYDFAQSYIGPVDFLLTGNNSKASLFAHNTHGVEVRAENASVEAILDFTSIPTSSQFNLSIVTEYSTFSNYTHRYSYLFYELTKPTQERFNHFTLLELENSTYTIYSIDISISLWNSLSGVIEERDYHITSLSSIGLNIYKNNNTWFSYGTNGLIIK
ncbi:MAG: hypothetical protein ACTSPI_13485, partial [Candidatus Heimdallarchaeaceae archaeon]